jgi:hypothetical protein
MRWISMSGNIPDFSGRGGRITLRNFGAASRPRSGATVWRFGGRRNSLAGGANSSEARRPEATLFVASDRVANRVVTKVCRSVSRSVLVSESGRPKLWCVCAAAAGQKKVDVPHGGVGPNTNDGDLMEVVVVVALLGHGLELRLNGRWWQTRAWLAGWAVKHDARMVGWGRPRGTLS